MTATSVIISSWSAMTVFFDRAQQIQQTFQTINTLVKPDPIVSWPVSSGM